MVGMSFARKIPSFMSTFLTEMMHFITVIKNDGSITTKFADPLLFQLKWTIVPVLSKKEIAMFLLFSPRILS